MSQIVLTDLLAAGYTPNQIRQQEDHLTLDDIHACLAYAREVISSERMFAVKGYAHALSRRREHVTNDSLEGLSRVCDESASDVSRGH